LAILPIGLRVSIMCIAFPVIFLSDKVYSPTKATKIFSVIR